MPQPSHLPTLHLCVATEQVLANVLPLRLLPWQRVVVVASDFLRDRQRESLDMLLRWIEHEALHRGLAPAHALQTEALPDTGMRWPELLGFAHNLARRLAQEHPGQPWCVNLSGGTKLMSQAFATAFAAQGVLVYCNTPAQLLEVLDPQGQAPGLPLPPDLLNLESYLDAQGYTLQSAQQASDGAWLATLQMRQALTVALVQESQRLRMVTPTPNGPRLLNLVHSMAVSSLPQRGGRGKPPRSFEPLACCREASPHHPVWRVLVEQLRAHAVAEVESWVNSELVLRWADEGAARYLAGGYLEEYAALCMLALGLPAEHWALNLRLRPRNSLLPQWHDYQELDLVLVWRNRMWVLECKAGLQLHQTEGPPGQAVLNKLDALTKHIAGSQGEAWVVTPLPFLPEYHAPVLERAQRYGIHLLHGPKALAQLPERLGEALGHPPVAALSPGLPALSAALDDSRRMAQGGLRGHK